MFCLFVINFFPLYIKYPSSNTPLLFFYSVFPVTDKINSCIFHELIYLLCKSTPKDYFQWSGSRTVKCDGAKLYAI